MNGAAGLRKLMERSGAKSQEAFAELLGYSRASSVQRYLSDAIFGDKPLPAKIIERLLEHVTGTGCPPITEDDILSLGGMSALTRTKHGSTIIAHSAAVFTGRYVPVLSVRDAMNLKLDNEKEDTEEVAAEWVVSDKPMAADERMIRIMDNSMAPTYPKGALAVIKYLGKDVKISPGNLVFLKVTDVHGAEIGEIRRYKLSGYSPTGEKIEEFVALAHDDGYPNYKSGGPEDYPRIEVKARVLRVIVTIEC